VSRRTVQATASLHEKSVQAIAERGVPRRPRRAPKARKHGDIAHIKVRPEVWKRAKEIIFVGTYSKIEIVDEWTVIVR
jgi:hypothetical protein